MEDMNNHYKNHLAPVYTWMNGGFETAKTRYTSFFKDFNLEPAGSAVAVDLGCGPGFQTIPLVEMGYTVTAVDLNSQLLDELGSRSTGLAVTIVRDDLLALREYIRKPVELVICMADTIIHLESKDQVTQLCEDVFQALEDKGRFVITFRDMTVELKEEQRFIPVKSDDETIFTCFLEYEKETVKGHDIIHKKTGGQWEMDTSYYRKLRLSKNWVVTQLKSIGFEIQELSVDKGMVTVIGRKNC